MQNQDHRNSSCFIATLLGVVLAGLSAARAEDDWRSWRGPSGNGVAEPEQDPPLRWSETQNVVWKASVSGRGHSSPIVVNNRVILTTSNDQDQRQSALCYDRSTGKLLWNVEVNQGGYEPKIHRKNTHATPTAASDGERVYVVFINHDNVQLTALDTRGRKVWQRNAGKFIPRAYKYGYAPSPILYQSSVIVASEFEADGFLAAFDCATGREIWRQSRPPLVNYSTPVVANVAGQDQLLISGANLISSYSPQSGRPRWSAPGLWKVTCGTMVWAGDLVFASGGFPSRGTMAIRADGSGEVVWKNNVKCYEQSLIVHDGHVYAVDDGSVAHCWRVHDGKEMWKRRLGGGAISASPVLANGRVYAFHESGETFVFRASPERYEAIARNRLGDETFAAPAVCGNQLFVRVAHRRNDQRHESLYCIGRRD